MRLVWFGGTALRLHIGGVMIGVDPGTADGSVDAAEIISGVEREVALFGSGDLPPAPAAGSRRRTRTALEAEAADALTVSRLGAGAVLIDAADEPAVVLLAGDGVHPGRWADGAVVVLFESLSDPAAMATAVLAEARPRLVALAVAEAQVEPLIASLADRRGDAGLVALQPGLGIEV